MGRERRQLKRFMARIPAMFMCGGMTSEGYVKNLSKEGLFLRTESLPKPGEPVHVLLRPPEGERVEVKGVVCWTTDQVPDRSPQKGFGMLIDAPTTEYLELFQNVLLN